MDNWLTWNMNCWCLYQVTWHNVTKNLLIHFIIYWTLVLNFASHLAVHLSSWLYRMIILINCDASSLAPWIWSYVTYTAKWQEVWRACLCVLAQSVLAVLYHGMTVWTRHRDYKCPLWRGMGLTGSDTCCSHPTHSVLVVEWLLETFRLLLLLKCLPHIGLPTFRPTTEAYACLLKG